MEGRECEEAVEEEGVLHCLVQDERLADFDSGGVGG